MPAGSDHRAAVSDAWVGKRSRTQPMAEMSTASPLAKMKGESVHFAVASRKTASLSAWTVWLTSAWPAG